MVCTWYNMVDGWRRRRYAPGDMADGWRRGWYTLGVTWLCLEERMVCARCNMAGEEEGVHLVKHG